MAFMSHEFSDKEITFPCPYEVNEAMRQNSTWPLGIDHNKRVKSHILRLKTAQDTEDEKFLSSTFCHRQDFAIGN